MHDEQTRKYLQSIKRLLTFAQRKHPALPSMCWEFNSGGSLPFLSCCTAYNPAVFPSFQKAVSRLRPFPNVVSGLRSRQ